MTFMRDAIFGIAAANHQRANLVADFPVRHARSQRDDLTRDLQSGNIRRALWRRIQTLALHDIGPVDARGGNLDQNFACARRGHRALFGNKHLRSAGRCDADCSHV